MARHLSCVCRRLGPEERKSFRDPERPPRPSGVLACTRAQTQEGHGSEIGGVGSAGIGRSSCSDPDPIMPFKADAARRHHIPADSPTADRLDERCSPCVIWSSSYSSRAPVFMLWSPRRVSNRTVVSAGDHGNAGSTLNRDRADDSFREKVMGCRRRRRDIEYNDGFRACGGERG
jgi:hypothetical protein